MEKRNGFVDFLKFVFAIIILFHHSVELFRGSNTYFISGYIAVEFYFMVSGYLLAKKSECSLTSDNCSKSIYDENIKAFIRKVKSFFPYILVAALFSIVISSVGRFDPVKILTDVRDISIELFGLQMLGFIGNIATGVTWYISVLLIASFLLFPLLHTKRDLLVKYICPILSVAIYGYLFYTGGCINHPGTWLGLCHKGLLRGFADIFFGIVAYTITDRIDSMESRKYDVLFNIAEPICFFSVIAYAIFHGVSDGCDFFVLPLILLLVAISFSSRSLGRRIFRGRIWNFLGVFSLSVYLNHYYVVSTLLRLLPSADSVALVVMYVTISLVLAVLNYLIGTALIKSRHKPAAYAAAGVVFILLCFGASGTDHILPKLNFAGSGTIDDPYLVSTESDIRLFRDMVNNGYGFEGEYLRQTSDIDLSSEGNWTPIGIMPDGALFYGNYDGDGFRISNVTINRSGEDVGFFGKLAGTVENVVMADCNVTGNCVGGISSHGANNAKIINCVVTGFLHGDTRAGGIADNMMGTIINSVSYASTEGPATGGISGYDSNIIINCYSIYGTDGTDLDGSAVNDTTIDQLNSYLTELADEPYSNLLNKWEYDENGLLVLTHKSQG